MYEYISVYATWVCKSDLQIIMHTMYLEMNFLISQPKHMSRVLKITQ